MVEKTLIDKLCFVHVFTNTQIANGQILLRTNKQVKERENGEKEK